MNDFFDKAKKLSHQQSKEMAALCAAAAVLLLIAGFISSGGMTKVNNLLALNHITPGSQAGCVFHCNNSAYDMEELNPMQGGVVVSTVAPGSSVDWIWNAGAYGANNFSQVCMGETRGSVYECTVQEGSANTNFGAGCAVPICNNPYQLCDSKGNCQTICTSITYSPCGNADDVYGHTCYGPGGGVPPNYSCPGYDGNTPGTLPITAPLAPGTYPYWFCSNYLLHANAYNSNLTSLGCLEADLTVVSPNPTVTIDAGAGSGVTRTVTVGTPTTITATFTPGTGDTITHTSIVDNNFNAVPGMDTNVPPTTKTYTFTPNAAGSYIFYPSAQTNGHPAWNNYGRSVTVVVAAAPSCANGLNNSYLPSCTCNAPNTIGGGTCNAPSSCANGLNSSYAPSCTCPVGQTQSGSSCVASSCANGLNSSYAPSCTCPVGQTQSGSTCVPIALCANGLNNSYAPSCVCPVGQYQPLASATCVALPVCANGLNSSYSPGCTCPSGQEQSGASCVLSGIINSLTANPSRVLKGNTATITWSTSHMATCALSGLATAGTSALSSALSSSVTPIINSKTIFTLSCIDAAGVPYASSVTVNLIPQTIEK